MSKDNDLSFPFLSPQLIAALDARFPNRCPRLAQTDREIWFEAGQRSVVEILKETLKRQQNNIMSADNGLV